MTDEQLDSVSSSCKSATTAFVDNAHGGVWFYARIRDTGYYHLMTPNSPTCRNASRGDGLLATWPASSLHPGGANTLYFDGSVRFVGANVNERIWRAQGTHNGADDAGTFATTTNL
jgi:prepilin-type processing-associated H-X9-DG protein